ncbi:MAG TPA: zf-HC2 domain-containing protein [Acidobacteriaceae bacterium]|nr:zf-HC2 domain-containing protein [Acidobacteriaceae bacterium]
MADNRQFGGGKERHPGDKVRQFGDSPLGLPGDSQHCAECEAMLADAFDGILSPEDQATFDRHTVSCKPCGEMVADARRGVAWLEMLRDPAPEPPAHLLERILAETSAMQIPGHDPSVHAAALHRAGFAPASFAPALTSGSAHVIAFPRQTFAAVRRSGFGKFVWQPRLAMTAAMAFFSIALTLNITGVHPSSLHLADLKPSSLRHDFFTANARVVQYYEGLRVVYELESRVRDLQSAQDPQNDGPAGRDTAPAGESTPTQPLAQPEPIPNAAPAGKQQQPGAAHQPGATQHNRGTAPANPRTSRREDLLEPRRMVVAESLQPGFADDDPRVRTARRRV